MSNENKARKVCSQCAYLQDVEGNIMLWPVLGQEFLAPTGAWLDNSVGGWRSEIPVGGRWVTLMFAGSASDPAKWLVR